MLQIHPDRTTLTNSLSLLFLSLRSRQKASSPQIQKDSPDDSPGKRILQEKKTEQYGAVTLTS
jgi:hypothetical protein